MKQRIRTVKIFAYIFPKGLDFRKFTRVNNWRIILTCHDFCATIILDFYKRGDYVVLTDITGEVLIMKKTLSLVFAFVLALVVVLGLASCGKDVEFNVNFVFACRVN